MNINRLKEVMGNLLKNKRRLTLIILIVLIMLNIASYATPKIDVSFQIQNVTEKDFNMFVDNNDGVPSENKAKENCRFISFYIKTLHPFLLVRDVKIVNESLPSYLQETQYFSGTSDEVKFLGQYTTSGGNEYSEGIDVYMKGMTDERLIKYFEDYKIEVSWVNLFTGKNKKVFYLKDYLE